MDVNPLTTSALGVVILLMAGALRIMYNEIKRLNAARLKDWKDIESRDKKVIGGVTRALNNLRQHIESRGNGDKPI